MEDRRYYIGGSDIAAIFGLSPYKSPYELYLEKTADCWDEGETNQYCYWGKTLEPIVREEFSKRSGLEVSYDNELRSHPVYNFMRAHLDGYIKEENAILEIKCTSAFNTKEFGQEMTAEIPIPYLLQVAYYCCIFNADKAYIAALIGGNDYKVYLYERDRDLEARIITQCFNFWLCVQRRQPPEPQSIDDLKLMYSQSTEESLVADDTIIECYQQINEIRQEKKKLDKKEEGLKMEMMSFMGSSSVLTIPSGSKIATWKCDKNNKRVFKLVNGE